LSSRISNLDPALRRACKETHTPKEDRKKREKERKERKEREKRGKREGRTLSPEKTNAGQVKSRTFDTSPWPFMHE